MGKGKENLSGWFAICPMVTFPLRGGAFLPLLLCLLSLVPPWPFLLTFHSLALGSMLLWVSSQFHKAPRGRVALCSEPLESGASGTRVSKVEAWLYHFSVWPWQMFESSIFISYEMEMTIKITSTSEDWEDYLNWHIQHAWCCAWNMMSDQ